MELSYLPPVPDPERDKETFSSYTHEWNGEKRRIFVNNEHPEIRLILESIDLQNLSPAFIKGVIRTQILHLPETQPLVLKSITAGDYPSQRKTDYAKNLLRSSPVIELVQKEKRTKSQKIKKRIEEIGLNWVAQGVNSLSLIQQLTIGRKVAGDFKTQFGIDLQVEEPLGAIVSQTGKKVICYKFYDGVDNHHLSGQQLTEYNKFEDDIHEKLFQLGYGILDLQFLIIDKSKPIDLSNTVLIDTEHLAPLIKHADEYEGRRENILDGEYSRKRSE